MDIESNLKRKLDKQDNKENKDTRENKEKINKQENNENQRSKHSGFKEDNNITDLDEDECNRYYFNLNSTNKNKNNNLVEETNYEDSYSDEEENSENIEVSYNKEEESLKENDDSEENSSDESLDDKDDIFLPVDFESHNSKSKGCWVVKLYQLDENSIWKDVATGKAFILMNVKNPILRMISDKTGDIILNLKIKDFTFTRQRESIITWKSENIDETKDNNNALSFHNIKSINELCETISILYGCDKVQEVDPLEILNSIEPSNLAAIIKCLTNNEQSQGVKQNIIEKVTANNNFFSKLINFFFEQEEMYLENKKIKENEENKNKTALAGNNSNISEKTSNSNEITVTTKACTEVKAVRKKSSESNDNKDSKIICNNENCINNSNNSNNTDLIENNTHALTKCHTCKNYNTRTNILDDNENKEMSCISNNVCENNNNEEEDKDFDAEIMYLCANDENLFNLKMVFLIYKKLLSIGNQQIIEMMLSDENYIGTFGALEYHLESHQPTPHRDFFQHTSKFHNLLNITNESQLQKIRLIYRLSYLRDVAIGRFIEELTLHNINMIINIYYNEIINYLFRNNDNTVLKRLIANLKRTIEYAFDYQFDSGNTTKIEIEGSSSNVYSKKKDLLNDDDVFAILSPIKFLKEMFGYLKDTMINSKNILDMLLNDYDLLTVLIECLNIFQPDNCYYRYVNNGIKDKKDILYSYNDNSDSNINENIKKIRKELYKFSIEALTYLMNGTHIVLKKKIIDSFHLYYEKYNQYKLENINKPYEGRSIIQVLLNNIYFEENLGLKYEIRELIKCLIDEGSSTNIAFFDSYNTNANKEDKAEFFVMFFELYSEQLIHFLSTDFKKCSGDMLNNNNNSTLNTLNTPITDTRISGLTVSQINDYEKFVNDSKQMIIEFFSFTLISHIKVSQLFVEKSLIKNLLSIKELNNKYLNLFLVKFIKTLLFNLDEKLFNELSEKNYNLFEVLFSILKQNIPHESISTNTASLTTQTANVNTNNTSSSSPDISQLTKRFKKLININKSKELTLNILCSSILDIFKNISKSSYCVSFAEALQHEENQNYIKELSPHTSFISPIIEEIIIKKNEENKIKEHQETDDMNNFNASSFSSLNNSQSLINKNYFDSNNELGLKEEDNDSNNSNSIDDSDSNNDEFEESVSSSKKNVDNRFNSYSKYYDTINNSNNTDTDVNKDNKNDFTKYSNDFMDLFNNKENDDDDENLEDDYLNRSSNAASNSKISLMGSTNQRLYSNSNLNRFSSYNNKKLNNINISSSNNVSGNNSRPMLGLKRPKTLAFSSKSYDNCDDSSDKRKPFNAFNILQTYSEEENNESNSDDSNKENNIKEKDNHKPEITIESNFSNDDETDYKDLLSLFKRD